MIVVSGALMFDDAIRGYVPAAIVAGGSLVIATVAVKGAAVKELLQAFAIVRSEVAGFTGKSGLAAAALALARFVLFENWGIVIVQAATDEAGAVAEGARRAHLGSDGFAN